MSVNPPSHDIGNEKAAEYRRAFSKIKPDEDWRGPVEGYVKAEELVTTIEAIMFMTATECTVEPVMVDNIPAFKVRSIGYRAGPAGDH